MIRLLIRRILLFGIAAGLGASLAAAQAQSAITLEVDATQAPVQVIRTHMVMPVQPGSLTLYFPKWIPGEHAPDGPVGNVAGLRFTAGGKEVPWERDPLDVFTFHVNVPEGASSLEVAFEYLEPPSGPYSGGASATPKMAVINWNQNLLYPAGIKAQDIIYHPTLKLPAGWKYGTPLPIDNASGSEIRFKPVALNRLVDSPVITGEYLRVVNVTPPGEPIHHEIDIAADSEAALAMPPETVKEYTNLVAESGKLFGSRHYRDYHFLLSLSDHVAHFGLEHHESDDSRVGERSLLTPASRAGMAGLLPHEFVHSWNGKFRRPADLSPPYYEEAMKTDLLWVYEGLTDYLGPMLTARSGLWTPEQYRDYMASIAAMLGPGRPGRTWRDLHDTTFAPLLHVGGDWVSWRRAADYYPEGDLVWMWVDTIIRQQTHGRKSIDNFCHIFHGGPNNGPELKTYTFDDLVNTLNQVVPYDWADFLRERLTSLSPEAPVGGIENGGWKIEYTEQESALMRAQEARFHRVSAAYSIGLTLNAQGRVTDCIWNGPAFRAGVTPGMQVIGVNGRKYTPQLFKQAIHDTKAGSHPIELLVLNEDYYRTCTINYQGGERYPHLVRVEGKRDLLGQIIKPRAR